MREHLQNARSLIHESLEPNSNTTVARDVHSAKHSPPSCSTAEGTKIEESEEQRANAVASMEESLEPDSNVSVERDSQPAKHP
jgi:hypothetical protein